MGEPIIQSLNLTKIYQRKDGRELIALDSVNFEINEGEFFGLLGPNGAGKTTLISLLSTLRTPTRGYALINGYNILNEEKKIKRIIGVMLEKTMLYYRMTGFQNLKFFAKISDIKDYREKIKNLINLVGLDDWADEYIERYSNGMKMKLALARVLLLDPKILILDEPTLGLDVKAVKEFTELIKSLQKTVLITSHDMHMMEKVCHRIAFINHGKILKIDTQANLKKYLGGGLRITIKIENQRNQLLDDLRSKDFISKVEENVDRISFILNDQGNYPALFSILQRYPIASLIEDQPSLEDVFIQFY